MNAQKPDDEIWIEPISDEEELQARYTSADWLRYCFNFVPDSSKRDRLRAFIDRLEHSDPISPRLKTQLDRKIVAGGKTLTVGQILTQLDLDTVVETFADLLVDGLHNRTIK